MFFNFIYLKKNILSSKYLLCTIIFPILLFVYFLLCFLSSAQNSLNSRAGLESKEFRFFSPRLLFNKNVEIQCFFSKNHRGKGKLY